MTEMEMATQASAASAGASQASRAAALSLECAAGIRTSLRALKRDVALSFRICSRDFGVLGRELLAALNAKQERERAASMALEHERSMRRRAQHKALEAHGGAIRVLCKVRPLLPNESSETGESPSVQTPRVTVPSPHDIHVAVPAMPTSSLDSALASLHSPVSTTAIKSFSFERVFTDETTHAQVYKEIQPLVLAATDGLHACVFAYGQTGAGKTHSIYGASKSDSAEDSERGLAWRAAETIFETVREQEALFDFSVTLQMVEIYNDEMYDLLGAEDDGNNSGSNSSGEVPSMLVVPFQTMHNGSASGPGFVSKRPVGEIRHGERGVYLRNVEAVAVHSAEDVVHVMQSGEINRTVHQSNSSGNDHSSRSHCVAMIDIQRCSHVDGQIDSGRFVMVDLAGSERLIRSETSGQRLREAQHINKSLAAIGDVMAALLAKDKHVPYRNTKLTHLLQDSLGGTDSQTLILVHVSPSSRDVAETVNTLKFASRVNHVHHAHSKRNERQEINRLHGMIASQATQLQTLQDKLTAELELRRKYEKRLEEYRQEDHRRRAKEEEQRVRSTPSKQSPQTPSPDQQRPSGATATFSTPSKIYGAPSHQQSTVSSSRLLSTPERRWNLYNRKDSFKPSNGNTAAGHTPRVAAKHSTAGGQENISENIPRSHRSSAVNKLPPVPEKTSTSYGMATPVRRTRRMSLMAKPSERKAMRSPLRVAASQQHAGVKRKTATPAEVRGILKKQRLSLDPQAAPLSSSSSAATSGASSDISGKQVSFDLSSRMAAATRVGGVQLLPSLTGAGLNGVSTSSALPPRMPKSMLRTPMAATRVPAPATRVRASLSSPPGLASPMTRVRTSQSPSKRKWNGGWR